MATTSSTSNRGTIGSSRDAVAGSQGRRGGNYSSANSQAYKGRPGPGKSHGGFQSLGKVVATSRRMPQPASLPSLRSEYAGNDPNVSLVPSGGGGWKSNKDTKEAQRDASGRGSASPPRAKHPTLEESTGKGDTERVGGTTALPSHHPPSQTRPHPQSSSPPPLSSTGHQFKSDFPSLEEQEGMSKKELEELHRRHREGEGSPEPQGKWKTAGSKMAWGDHNSRDGPPPQHGPPPNMGYGNRSYHHHHHHAPPPPIPPGPYSHQYLMHPPPPPGPSYHGGPPIHGPPHPGPPSRGSGGPPHFQHPPHHGGYQPPYYPPDPYKMPDNYREDISRPPTVKMDDIKSMEVGEDEEEGWAGHHEEVDYSKEVVFLDSSDEEGSPKKSRIAKVSTPDASREQHQERETKEAPGKSSEVSSERAKTPEKSHVALGPIDSGGDKNWRRWPQDRERMDRRTDGDQIPPGRSNNPMYHPYPQQQRSGPLPYPPPHQQYPPNYNRGANFGGYPPGPPPSQHYSHQYPSMQHMGGNVPPGGGGRYPPNPGPMHRGNLKKNFGDRDDFHRGHDKDSRGPKRKWEEPRDPARASLMNKEQMKSPSPQLEVRQDEKLENKPETPTAGNEALPVQRVSSLSSDNQDEKVKGHVTFADNVEELEDSSHLSRRGNQPKLMLRKLVGEKEEGGGDGRQDGKDKQRDSKGGKPADLRGLDSEDLSTESGKARTAWNMNERGPIISPKTLYEPEGKRSADKFKKYHAHIQEPSRGNEGPKHHSGGQETGRGSDGQKGRSTPVEDAVEVVLKSPTERREKKEKDRPMELKKKQQQHHGQGEDSRKFEHTRRGSEEERQPQQQHGEGKRMMERERKRSTDFEKESGSRSEQSGSGVDSNRHGGGSRDKPHHRKEDVRRPRNTGDNRRGDRDPPAKADNKQGDGGARRGKELSRRDSGESGRGGGGNHHQQEKRFAEQKNREDRAKEERSGKEERFREDKNRDDRGSRDDKGKRKDQLSRGGREERWREDEGSHPDRKQSRKDDLRSTGEQQKGGDHKNRDVDVGRADHSGKGSDHQNRTGDHSSRGPDHHHNRGGDQAGGRSGDHHNRRGDHTNRGEHSGRAGDHSGKGGEHPNRGSESSSRGEHSGKNVDNRSTDHPKRGSGDRGYCRRSSDQDNKEAGSDARPEHRHDRERGKGQQMPPKGRGSKQNDSKKQDRGPRERSQPKEDLSRGTGGGPEGRKVDSPSIGGNRQNKSHSGLGYTELENISSSDDDGGAGKTSNEPVADAKDSKSSKPPPRRTEEKGKQQRGGEPRGGGKGGSDRRPPRMDSGRDQHQSGGGGGSGRKGGKQREDRRRGGDKREENRDQGGRDSGPHGKNERTQGGGKDRRGGQEKNGSHGRATKASEGKPQPASAAENVSLPQPEPRNPIKNYDLNSYKIAIADDINVHEGTVTEEWGAVAVDNDEFVEVTSKKTQKVKQRKEKEELKKEEEKRLEEQKKRKRKKQQGPPGPSSDRSTASSTSKASSTWSSIESRSDETWNAAPGSQLKSIQQTQSSSSWVPSALPASSFSITSGTGSVGGVVSESDEVVRRNSGLGMSEGDAKAAVPHTAERVGGGGSGGGGGSSTTVDLMYNYNLFDYPTTMYPFSSTTSSSLLDQAVESTIGTASSPRGVAPRPLENILADINRIGTGLAPDLPDGQTAKGLGEGLLVAPSDTGSSNMQPRTRPVGRGRGGTMRGVGGERKKGKEREHPEAKPGAISSSQSSPVVSSASSQERFYVHPRARGSEGGLATSSSASKLMSHDFRGSQQPTSTSSKVAMTMTSSHASGGGNLTGDRVASSGSRGTVHHGRAGSRPALEGGKRRRGEPGQQRHLAGSSGPAAELGEKRKVSPPSKGLGEGKVSTDAGSAKTVGSMAVSKNVSYAEVLKTMRMSAENVQSHLGGSKVGSRCQTPSDTSCSPGQTRKVQQPLVAAGRASPSDSESIVDLFSSSSASSESSRKEGTGGGSPSRSFLLATRAKNSGVDGEMDYSPTSQVLGREGSRDLERKELQDIALNVAAETQSGSDKDLQQPPITKPRTPVGGQLPQSPLAPPLTPENKTCSPTGHPAVSPKQLTPVGRVTTSPAHRIMPQQDQRLHEQPLASSGHTEPSQPMSPSQEKSPVQVQAAASAQSLGSGRSQAEGKPVVIVAASKSAEGLQSQDSGAVLTSTISCPTAVESPPQQPSDGILAPAPDKRPLVLPPGLATPLYPHMISSLPSHHPPPSKPFPVPPQTLSGLMQQQQQGLLPPSLPHASRHPPPSVAQPTLMELEKVAAVMAQHQQHLHGHSPQGPPIPFNPQAAAPNSAHPRPLLPGQPSFVQQQYDALLSILQHQHIQKLLVLQQQQQQQQQQHLAKAQLDKMEHSQATSHVFLDPVKTAHLQQQRPQRLFQAQVPAVSGKVEGAPPVRAAMQPYLMHTPPQHPVAHMPMSRPNPGPMYPPPAAANYGPPLAMPQRQPLMLPSEPPPSSSGDASLLRSTSDPSVREDCIKVSPDSSQTTPQLATAEGDDDDREQSGDVQKSSSLSIKATPFVPKSQTAPLTVAGNNTSLTAAGTLPRSASDHGSLGKKPGLPHPLPVAGTVMNQPQVSDQAGQLSGPLPPNIPPASLLYNSVRMPPPSTVVMMSQLMKPAMVTAPKKGRDSQPYSVLPTPPDRAGLLQNAPLHRQMSGGGGNGSRVLGDKSSKENIPLYRYPQSHLGLGSGTDILGGMDMGGGRHHHMHQAQKVPKGFHPGHPAGAMHSGKNIIPPPGADMMLPGAGRSPVLSGNHPQRDAALKGMHTTQAVSNSKRALLPTPPHVPSRMPLHGGGSQPSWSGPPPLHPSAPPTSHSHLLGRPGHTSGGPLLFPSEQSLAGIPPTGYGSAGPNPGMLASLPATYTQNQV